MVPFRPDGVLGHLAQDPERLDRPPTPCTRRPLTRCIPFATAERNVSGTRLLANHHAKCDGMESGIMRTRMSESILFGVCAGVINKLHAHSALSQSIEIACSCRRFAPLNSRDCSSQATGCFCSYAKASAAPFLPFLVFLRIQDR